MKRKVPRKGVRVDKPEPLPQIAPPDIVKTEEWEAWVTKNASHFNVCWKCGVGQVTSSPEKFGTLKKAIDFAQADRRRMVYAVTASGRSVMIASRQYQEFLKLREES